MQLRSERISIASGAGRMPAYLALPAGTGTPRAAVIVLMEAHMRATLEQLRRMPEVGAARIGVTGFCMGGRLSFLAACELGAELRACAPFYADGIGALLERAEKISCPLHQLLRAGGPCDRQLRGRGPWLLLRGADRVVSRRGGAGRLDEARGVLREDSVGAAESRPAPTPGTPPRRRGACLPR